jgi:ribonucleoside-diphosphate reductase alpha chain
MQISPMAKRLLEKRYLKRNFDGVLEVPESLFLRVAKVAAQVELAPKQEEVARKFYQVLLNLDFLPNSPTLINAGRPLNQLAACFVLPVEDSIDSIFSTLKKAALIHKSGGGTGFDFSKLRPRGSLVSTTGGFASGPISFIKVFDAATTAIKQGGTRRGANMAVLRVDHPDILEFIEAKSKPGHLTNFNLSVGLTDKFIKAVKTNDIFPLSYKGEIFKTIPAQKIFRKIAYNAWQNGEPGVLYLDTINKANPTPDLGFFSATNPCGEQPLLPYEACTLGSINLENMTYQGKINWQKLQNIIIIAVRFLDNLIDAGSYPLPEIEKKVAQSRKIGLGVMGWANLLYKLLIPYNSLEAIRLAEKTMAFIQSTAYKASKDLALEKGSFPNINLSIYQGKQLRNATRTTIAPTGSLSIIANTSPGIEPVFALAYRKRAIDEEFKNLVNPAFRAIIEQKYSISQCKKILEQISKTGKIQNCSIIDENLKKVFITAPEITAEWHIKMQAAFQKYCDNAVAKTVNLASEATVEDILDIFIKAHELHCKGVTVYRSGSRQKEAQQAGLY